MSDVIQERLAGVLDQLIEIRHELHAHPEIAYQEHQTSALLARSLGQIAGLTVKTGLARGTGVLGTLVTGRPGPVLAFRADIDALPIQEESSRAYASQNGGFMHACGHDGHATCLLGTAMVLSAIRDQLCGTIKFIFQPAEESGHGGQAMIDSGVLDDPPVEAIFGLHGWPAIKVGSLATRPGAVMASTDSFRATIHGRGAHGASPHLGCDPIVAASHVVTALQTIIARTLDPVKAGVVTVGRLNAGTAINIIPTKAELAGTIRSLDPDVREHLRTQVEQVIRHTAAAFGCRAEVELGRGYPVVVNDARMTELVGDVAGQVLGPQCVDLNRPQSMGGEDFAYYLQRVRGCFFFIGACPREQEKCPALHTPDYDFPDEAIGVGVRVFCGLALRLASSSGA